MFSIILRQRKFNGIWGAALLALALYVAACYRNYHLTSVKYVVCGLVFVYGIIRVGLVMKDADRVAGASAVVAGVLLLSVSSVLLLLSLGNRFALWYEFRVVLIFLLFVQAGSFIVYGIVLLPKLNSGQSLLLAACLAAVVFAAYRAYIEPRVSGLPEWLAVPAACHIVLCVLLRFRAKKPAV
jgi:hypothetical protein